MQVICFFWIFGDNLEDKMGPIWLIIFYIISGISAGVAQFTFDPSSPIPDVGESGAIAGITGGYLLLFPKAKVDIFTFLIVLFKILPILAWVMLGLWFGLQLLNILTSHTSGGGGVCRWVYRGVETDNTIMDKPWHSWLVDTD